MSGKVYLVYERIPYQGIDDVLHVFLSEKEAEKAVEHLRKEHQDEYERNERIKRFSYMIRDIEEEFKP